MKMILWFMLLSASACVEYTDIVREFIPGTYIRHNAGEFGLEWDTITIIEASYGLYNYHITRRWRSERIVDGRNTDPVYRIHHAPGSYFCKDQTLWVRGFGEFYRFDLENRLLINEWLKYQKL